MPKLFNLRTLFFVTLAICFGLSFVIWSFILRNGQFNAIDFALIVKIQDKVPVFLDEYFIHLSWWASFPVTLAILVVGLLAFRRWLGVVTAVILFGGAHIVEILGKEALHHPPPPFMFYRHPTGLTFTDSYVQEHFSYPSGHSMRVIFLFLVLGMVVWQSKRIPLVIRLAFWGIGAGIVALTLISRASLGEHWPSDVVGGMFLGLCFGTLELLFIHRKN